MSDIRNLLDSIIHNTNDTSAVSVDREELDDSKDAIFDKNAFKEKLSMYVLKDVISAMMHDETADIDNMIDQSIMKHITKEYEGSCYDYLSSARDNLKSPLIGDIIQEIDSKVDEIEDKVNETKDVEEISADADSKEILKNVENYDQLRQRIKDVVAKKVVDDVAAVITTGNDAPVFDDIDDKLTQSNDVEDGEEDVTTESMILRMCGSIVKESYDPTTNTSMSTEEGLNQAIVEYCLNEMDSLFKQKPKMPLYGRYHD